MPALWIKLSRELHRALNVREQYGDLFPLAFERGFGLQDFVRQVLRGVGAGLACNDLNSLRGGSVQPA